MIGALAMNKGSIHTVSGEAITELRKAFNID
jgi:hypothetical protein